MGKRSEFERKKQDFYVTPYEACLPLISLLPPELTFYEPCAGNGAIIKHLQMHDIKCEGSSDLYTSPHDLDARTHQYKTPAKVFITNPPWDRKLLHPIIENLSRQKPTWLLIDADWMHTKQASEILFCRCTYIISIGRVKWFPDSTMTGKDNACWYLFYDQPKANTTPIKFIPRQDLGTRTKT